MVDKTTIELKDWYRTVLKLEQAFTFREQEDIHRLVAELFLKHIDFVADKSLVSRAELEEMGEEIYALIRKAGQ